MHTCKYCASKAINIDPKKELCDVCYYRIPLIDLCHRIENDIDHFKNGKKEIEKKLGKDSVENLTYLIRLLTGYKDKIINLNLTGSKK